MNRSGKADIRLIIIAVACVVLVGLCVWGATWFFRSRNYGSAAQSTPSVSSTPDSTAAATEAPSESGQAEISCTATEELPAGLDASRFVKQGYELHSLFAVQSFSSPGDISVSRLVQYAFCYLYAENGTLVDTNPAAMTYRSATEAEIRAMVIRLFGSAPADLTESDLYNIKNKIYEMWQPNYSATVYATSSAVHTGNDWVFSVTYYTNAEKNEVSFTQSLTVRTNDAGYYLAAMA